MSFWPPLGRGTERRESEMTKFGVIALTGAAMALAACGGSSKTVTVTGSTPSAGNAAGTSGGGTTGVPSAVVACFQAAGAKVRGPRPAGQGSAIYVTTRDGAALGYVKAPNVTIAARVQEVFIGSGDKALPVKSDPSAFAFYKGTPAKGDLALLSKCAK
jgi:hypothetical protein